MGKIYFAIIGFLFITNQLTAQTTYTWVGTATGDYQEATNWSPNRSSPATNDILAFNATSSIIVNNVPLQTIGALRILSGTSSVSFATNSSSNILTLSAPAPLIYTTNGSILAADLLTINLSAATVITLTSGTFGIAPGTGGKVSINGTLTLNGGKLDFDVAGTGGATINSSSIVTYTSGTFNCINPGAVVWATGAIYNHNVNGTVSVAIPASTWVTGSTCNITGMNAGTLPPTGLGISNFANLTWNCPSQFGNVNLALGGLTVTIAGTFTIGNTNSKALILSGPGTAVVKTTNYLQNGSGNTVVLQGGVDSTTLSVSGTFTQTSGTLDGVNGSSAGTGILDLKGNVSRSNGFWACSSSSSGAQTNFQFSGDVIQIVSITGGSYTAPAAGRVNINVTNTNLATGIDLTSGSILKVFNTSSPTPASCTLAGKITPQDATAYVAYTGNATLIYSGAFFQTAGAAEFTTTAGAAPTNLTINNALGVTFPVSFSRTVPGTLSMLSGNLAIGTGNTLQLTNLTEPNQLSYSGGFITTGTLSRYYPTTGMPTAADSRSLFPFGTGANNRSVYVYFSGTTAGSGSATGMISVTHTPIVGITNPIPNIPDDILLDKVTKTYWTIDAGTFNPGTGGPSISLSAYAANIGSVDDSSHLRLTDSATAFGTKIPATGSNAVPFVGKTGLTLANITNKKLYIGSDSYNPLIIITFTWIGLGANSDWKTTANWSGGVGYPSASTEIAIITGTSGWQPTISTGSSISTYQLTVGSGMTLTMNSGAILNVFDNVSFGGNAVFDPNSTFGYASSANSQNVLGTMIYGNLSLSGVAPKIFPASVTVTGTYSALGISPDVTTNFNTFIYAGAGAQTIAPANYYNLTITGNRSGGIISLGNPLVTGTVIDIARMFDVSGLSNYNNPLLIPLSFVTVNFSAVSPYNQAIPGFRYALITTSNGPKTLDNAGSVDTTHAIYCRAFTRGTGVFTVAGSKVNFYVSGTSNVTYYFVNVPFYDMEISGDLQNKKLDISGGPVFIANKFNVTLINYQQVINNITYFTFNGTADQTITGFKTISATTPAFQYANVVIQGGNRNIILSPTDTIGIMGTFEVPRTATYNASAYPGYTPLAINPFSAGKGFTVTGSTVSFSNASGYVPLLIPPSGTVKYYNNMMVTTGTRFIEGDMTFNGNMSVIGGDALSAVLNIGDQNNARVINVLGNILDSTATVAGIRQIDMNTGTFGSAKINLAGNLAIKNNGQLMGTTSVGAKSNGLIVFNGTTPQKYGNFSTTYKNGIVNFTVGDGTTATNLTMNTAMNLLASSSGSNLDTLTVSNNASLNTGTYNIISNGSGNAAFNLRSGATLITANTGGVEGAATTTTDGSIRNDASMIRTYNDTASYVFNATTTTNTNFPAATTPFPMANLTIGNSINAATFSLNKNINVSNTLTLRTNATLALLNNYLNLRSTASTTARLDTVPNSANITYGTGRFVIERFYPARRSWRLITAPITADAGNSIFNSWQMGGATTTGSGTFVTSPTAPAGGLDVSPQQNFSLKTYNGTSFTGVSSTTAQLLSGTTGTAGIPDNFGMFLFVRGDRSTPALFNTANANNTTLRDTGKVQIHTQTFTLNGAANSFALVGNPFASPVDISSIMSGTANINPIFFWAYDPRINTQQGAYVTMTLIGGVWTPTPYNAAVTQDNNIQSSQAFFVQKSSSSPATMVFNETNKSAQNNLNLFRPISQPSIFATNLYLHETIDTRHIADGTLLIFDDAFSTAVDNSDALKFGNTNENFSMLRDTKALSVERRPTISSNDTIFFKLTKTTQRDYQFEFNPSNMDPLLTAFLEDSYTGIKTPVSVTGITTFNFSVNGDAKSAAIDRFRIVFKASAPLPVTYSSIKAYQHGDDIAVDWTVENEVNTIKYDVERSVDGITFSKVYTTLAKGTNSVSTNYIFLDNKAIKGNNFYRILSYSKTGGVEYSRTVLVKIGKTAAGISIYPNPVKGNTIGLALNNMEKGNYDVRLTNNIGQTLMVQQLSHAAGSSMETLSPSSKLSTGIYQLEVTAPDKTITTIKVIVQ